MAKMHSIQFLRRRKFLLMLPLLVFPFILLVFIALGGGKGAGISSGNTVSPGLNVKLPDPHFKKGAEKSKLTLYEEASRDSVMLRDKIKNDPYYTLQHHDMSFDSSKITVPDENESRIIEKLEKLKEVIHQNTQSTEIDKKFPLRPDMKNQALENFIDNQKTEPVPDQRMGQITAMLDKVMAIQHPEILQDSMARLKKQNAAPAFPVSVNAPDINPTSFGSGQENNIVQIKLNRFYELAEDFTIEKDIDNAIEAEIPVTQTLVSGSTIKLRLLNDIRINGHFISKNQFIYGTASLSNERLKIQFSSISSGQNILPVSLEAFDMDGLAGIYIPGSINRDVAKQSTDQAIGSINLATLDPSIGAQAAGAGIQAAKTLLSRKVKLVKVTVKAGYKVLLKDLKEK